MSTYGTVVDLISSGSGPLSVPFPYLAQSDLQVFADGAPYTGAVSWLSSSTIDLSPFPAANKIIRLQRRTSMGSPSRTFAAGPLAHGDLNSNALQATYGIQEAMDTQVLTDTNIVRPSGAGDGVTDDLTSLTAAMHTAQQVQGWVDLGGKTWGVNGTLSLGGGAKFRNGALKQLSPGDTSTTIKAVGEDGIRLENLRVFRNGDAAHGNTNTQAAIWLQDCTDPWLSDVEVSGNDKGNGVVCWNCDRPTLIRTYVHDMFYSTTETDDVIQGIWMVLCRDFLLMAPTVSRLGKLGVTTYLRNRYTRAIALADCRNGRIMAPAISLVDQAIDVSGSGGNSGIVITGGTVKFILSNGVKFANSATGCIVDGMLLDQVGTGGVIISGPAGLLENPTQDIQVVNCLARNTGASNGSGGTTAGFYLVAGTAPSDVYPKGIRMANCSAIVGEGSSAFTLADSSTFALTSALPLQTGQRIRLSSTVALPSGLSAGVDYWLVEVIEQSQFRVANSIPNAQDGVYMTGFSGGSGVHTITLQSDMSYGAYSTVATSDSVKPNELTNFHCEGAIVADVAGWPQAIADVFRTTPQSIGNNSPQVIAANAATYDALVLSGQATVTGVFTAFKPGRYALLTEISWAFNATGSRQLYTQLKPSGGSFATSGGVRLQNATDSVGTNALPQAVLWMGQMGRGDQVQAIGVQNSGGALNCTLVRQVFQYVGD